MQLRNLIVLVLASCSNARLNSADSSASVLNIKDTINRYALAIDLKNFNELADIFTVDVIADYSPPLGVLNGVSTVQRVLADALAPVTTQHGLTTQTITLHSKTEATTMTYYTAQHFGIGIWEGQVYTAYGRYEDHLILANDGWRIDKRHLIYMGPGIGNALIFGNGTNVTNF